MNGSKFKAVIDTNGIFMALYNPHSKSGRIIKACIYNKIELFSTDTVKEEIKRVLKRELSFSDEEIGILINSLPIIWVDKNIYGSFIDQTKVKHKSNKPVEALSLLLGCGILSADKHFKNRLNLDDVLEKIKD